MKKLNYIIGILLICCCFQVFAADAPPVALLKQVSAQMLASLDKSKDKIRSDPQIIDNIVRRVLLPQVDVDGMARSVIGRDYWTQASSADRQEFKNQFVQLVIDTYSAPLSSYSDEKVEFYPVRNFSTADTRAQVNSQIIRSNGPAIPVSYRLIRLGNGWKVYDFSVEGISMVQSFRSQFAGPLQQGGLANLLKQLRARQRQS